MSKVSLRPSTFAQGGGLIDDADVEIVRAIFTTGYGPSSTGDAANATTLCLTLKDGDDAEHDQYYSCGNGFVPSVDPKNDANSGRELVPVGDKTTPSGSSNMAMVINSLINAGLPEDLLDEGDIFAIVGTKGHVNRVPAPKRDGLPKREGKNADRVATVLVFTTVTGLPGEASKTNKAKPSATGKPVVGAAKPTAAAPSAADDELVDELKGYLMEVVGAAGEAGLKKVQIVQKLFAAIPKDDQNKKALLALAGKDEVLSSMDDLFSFDGKSIKMAE